jgi:low temperature requirement protein LtrA
MINQLLRTPRLRTGEAETERRSTWLELFYDLIFAIGVIALGNELRDHTTWFGALRFVVLGVPLWWAWVGHTLYSTRFDTDDLIHRLLTFVQMIGAAYMGVQLPSAFAGEPHGFAAGYIVTRIVLLLFYIRVLRYVPEARQATGVYLIGVGAGAALWTISLWLAEPYNYAVWVLGMAVDLLAPIVGRLRVPPLPIHTSHVPERFGLFILIVLGDCVLWAITMTMNSPRDGTAMTAGMCTFIIAAAIWWLYFGYMGAATMDTSVGIGQHFIYWHLPVTLSLVALGSGLSRAIADVHRHVSSPETMALAGGSTIAWLLSFGAVRVVSVHLPRVKRKIRIYLFGSVVAAVIAVGGLVVHPLAALAGLAVLYTGLAVHASKKDPAVDPTPQVPVEETTMAG